MDSMDSSEYIWCAKLTSKSKAKTYEGQDDGSLEQLVLKRACLGPEAKENDRNIVEVMSFDCNQDKVQVSICSLKVGLKEDSALSDITVFPPAVFKLVQGEGPVHLVANHMMLEGGDASDDDDIDSDDAFAAQTRPSPIKKPTSQQAKKAGKKPELMDEEVDDDMDDDDDELSDDDFEDDDDEDEEEDDDEEDEEEEEMPLPKKQKLKNDENKTPVAQQKGKMERKQPTTPKTPLQQKQNKTPQSGKKSPNSLKNSNQFSAKKKGKKV